MKKIFGDAWERRAEDHEPNWRAWTEHLRDRPVSILEVGSYEGRSALAWLRVLPQAIVVCVDPFSSATHGDRYGAHFDHNTADEQRRGQIVKVRARFEAYTGTGPFDVIYIDGDHTAAAVQRDAEQAWPMLTPGGVLVFDDEEWTHGTAFLGEPEKTPRPGIARFIQAHAVEIVVLAPDNGDHWQKAVRKR